MRKITEEELYQAYMKYPPGKAELLLCRFICRGGDLYRYFRGFVFFLAAMVFGGVIIKATGYENILHWYTIIFTFIMVPPGLYWIIVAKFVHDGRIRKIRKLLGLSKKEFDLLTPPAGLVNYVKL